MTITELLERLESAEWPNRELDFYIHVVATGRALNQVVGMHWFSGTIYWQNGQETHERDTPAYTESIDTASTLVPAGWVLNVGNDVPCWANVWHDVPDYGGRPFSGRATAMPLALCAAALRALSASPSLSQRPEE